MYNNTSKRTVSFRMPLQQKGRHQSLSDETDVDLPKYQRQKLFNFNQNISSTYKGYNRQQIGLKKYPRAFSVEPMGTTEEFFDDDDDYFNIITDSKISPVLPVDAQTYKQLNRCDCSLLPNCSFGDCIPLNTLKDDFNENEWKQQQQNKNKLSNDSQKRSIKTKCKENIITQHRLRPPPKHFVGSNLSSPGPQSSSNQSPFPGHSSPSSLSTNSEASTESAPASFLFRLPLTISKVGGISATGDCEVRVGSSCGNRKCQNKLMPINFAEMGLFVAPPSDTDPDEAFVVVERRKLFVK